MSIYEIVMELGVWWFE